ncbi:MerR family transcriptional regulator [Aminobacter ciceronei]|uniref:DNA-binding transcriptional MerR regulator n=1 Tax=Aminobacter ciceronei TaxID=150723 RepID=A0ABR6C8L7_9HYPH|nr:MerR family transcriptional regulator [Aminobacter ciceronei]MBA8907537.1 DNA-binding transcriptional MerR regulator [Aminobacter ciceronei]MBA9021362.1 DNA-binding transcriptional MerR regulator [Aminobacter ciceronei]
MENNRSIKIGRLAALSGLSERTLRHYEKLGIIAPHRTEGGTRLYHPDNVVVAMTAQKMRDLNIPVERIQAIATTRKNFQTGDKASAAMVDLLETMVDELGEQMSKVMDLQNDIIQTLRLVRRCKGCKNAPSPEGCPQCPMGTTPDRPPLAAVIWQ